MGIPASPKRESSKLPKLLTLWLQKQSQNNGFSGPNSSPLESTKNPTIYATNPRKKICFLFSLFSNMFLILYYIFSLYFYNNLVRCLHQERKKRKLLLLPTQSSRIAKFVCTRKPQYNCLVARQKRNFFQFPLDIPNLSLILHNLHYRKSTVEISKNQNFHKLFNNTTFARSKLEFLKNYVYWALYVKPFSTAIFWIFQNQFLILKFTTIK